MTKYLIWGTGKLALGRYEMMKNIPKLNNIKIVGFVDNDSKKWGEKIDGIPIIAPSEIAQASYDYICIFSMWKNEICQQLEEELCIPHERVRDFFQSYFVNCLNEKYASVQNDEIKEIIDNMKHEETPDVFYFPESKPKQMYEAFYDENADLHYILFENKRMYYKRNYHFIIEDGKKYVKDPWYEQDPNSPHLYEQGEISVCDGDVIVDAGTCEGNFSLHNIDKASKVFLIECNPDWLEALKYTFAPYQDKVVICDKFLSDTDSDKTITLNTLLKKENVSFIKMDIEGEEINALHGADVILKENKGLKLAICSYHRHGDEEKIKEILHSYQMKTETSKGYMLFLYDKDIFYNPELRRGIIRAVSD